MTTTSLIYINRRARGVPTETVAEFTSHMAARDALASYRLGDKVATYYISSRPCAAWRTK
jgi:hypothetical protein